MREQAACFIGRAVAAEDNHDDEEAERSRAKANELFGWADHLEGSQR